MIRHREGLLNGKGQVRRREKRKLSQSWSPQMGLLTTVSWWRAGAGVAIREEQGRAVGDLVARRWCVHATH